MLQARRQQRGPHRRSLVPTAPMPHRCIARTKQPSAHWRTRSTHRTDGLPKPEPPLTMLLLHPLLRDTALATRVLCLPCACTQRPEFRPKYETRNEREYPNRNPSPLEARTHGCSPNGSLDLCTTYAEHVALADIYIFEDMNYRSRPHKFAWRNRVKFDVGGRIRVPYDGT